MSVAGLSMYKQQQKEVKNSEGGKCRFCGGESHGEARGPESYNLRKEKCLAFGERCRKCDTLNHLTKQCHMFTTFASKKEDDKPKDETAGAVFTDVAEDEQCLFEMHTLIVMTPTILLILKTTTRWDTFLPPIALWEAFLQPAPTLWDTFPQTTALWEAFLQLTPTMWHTFPQPTALWDAFLQLSPTL